jgi:glycosyltransferase involved in cell wall biosynthesis
MLEPSVEKLNLELEKLINNPTLKSKLGEQLYKDIMEKHTWDKVTKSILDLKVKKDTWSS